MDHLSREAAELQGPHGLGLLMVELKRSDVAGESRFELSRLYMELHLKPFLHPTRKRFQSQT